MFYSVSFAFYCPGISVIIPRVISATRSESDTFISFFLFLFFLCINSGYGDYLFCFLFCLSGIQHLKHCIWDFNVKGCASLEGMAGQ